MKTILKIVLLLLFIPYITLAQSDNYKLLTDNQKSYYSVYFFSNYPGCISCIENMKNITKVTHNLGFKDYVYITNDDEPEFIEELRKSLMINITTINDKIGIYHKYFNVGTTNSIAIFNLKGEKVLQGNFSIDGEFISNFTELILKLPNLDKLKETAFEQGYFTLRENNGNPITMKGGYVSIYSHKNCRYYNLEVVNSDFYITDTSGYIIDKANLREKFNLKKPIFGNISWLQTDTTLLIPFLTYDYTTNASNNYLIKYFITNDEFKLTNLPLGLDSNNINIHIIGNPYNNGYLTRKEYHNPSTFKTELPFKLIDNMNNVKFKFGNFCSIYDSLNLWRSFWNLMYPCSNTIYSLQKSSLELQKYSSENGSLLGVINLEKSNNFKIYDKPNTKSIWTKLDWFEFLNNSTSVKYLYVDEDRKLILISTLNATYPLNNPDPIDSDIKNEYYVLMFDFDGKIIYEKEFTDNNFRVIDVQSSYYTTTKMINNNLVFEKYYFE